MNVQKDKPDLKCPECGASIAEDCCAIVDDTDEPIELGEPDELPMYNQAVNTIKTLRARVAELEAKFAALVAAATGLVGECEAEFTLDGYWNADGALVRRKTVNSVKKAIAADTSNRISK